MCVFFDVFGGSIVGSIAAIILKAIGEQNKPP